MHAEGYLISGTTKLLTFEGAVAQAPYDELTVEACLDVSEVEVVDEDGVSKVNPRTGQMSYALEIGFKNDGEQLLLLLIKDRSMLHHAQAEVHRGATCHSR